MKNKQPKKTSAEHSLKAASNIFSTLYSFVTTLQYSFQVIPILLSALTVLSTVPLIHYLLPSFLAESYVLAPLLVAISIYAAYYTYSELTHRAKLDKQIEKNRLKNKELKQQNNQLSKKLDNQIKEHKNITNALKSKMTKLEKSLKIKVPATIKETPLQRPRRKCRK
jgi:cell division protein FtsL